MRKGYAHRGDAERAESAEGFRSGSDQLRVLGVSAVNVLGGLQRGQ